MDLDALPETWNPAPVSSESLVVPVPDRRLCLALALCEGIGEVGFHRLLAVFGSPEAVFAAPEWELKEAWPRLGAGALIDLRRGPDFAAVEAQEESCRRQGFKLVTWREAGYPTPLLDLASPPPLLYLRGEWRAEDCKALAVVGTRRPSPYGEKSSRSFGLRLAEAGWTVVSGLARGVDTLAHESALRGGGRTVAVLGSGLDRLYPPENADLARRIAEAGCVISEFPLGMDPRAENFPRRNRIISGLSCGTLVVEAGNDSGSLITANYALDQGREVFAVPGAILTPGSRGTHKLIKEGAHLAEDVEDLFRVLEGLPQAAPGRRYPVRRDQAPVQRLLFAPSADEPGVAPSASGSTSAAVPITTSPEPRRPKTRRPAADLKESHRLLLDALGPDLLSLDGLADRMRARPGRAALPTHRLMSELLQLEVLGQVRRLPGAQFRRA